MPLRVRRVRRGDDAVTRPRLEVTREQVIAFRRTTGSLDRRLPAGAESLRAAAWAGLQDSMPRAALLSIHARVDGTQPDSWADPALAQVWGPRFSAYVVAERDAAIFTLGRLPLEEAARRRAEKAATSLETFLAGRRMTYGAAGRAMGVNANSLRYGTATGRIRIRWEGARQPVVWTVPAPTISADDARVELARRYLHVFGPGTVVGFGRWAGVRPSAARLAFETLAPSLISVRTPIGEGSILESDEAELRAA
ncbi:MAG TPA: crosslink repair DNA glycosylase YcaQ family protein, partial [Candidatus Limnocylindrales bacterium]|nr:crosslink repair DNA glycosylase YcaQ family protein [Candidatus Limnocylindrales bacterium]